jgi:hypothetical protein
MTKEQSSKTDWIPGRKQPTRVGWFECSICRGYRHYWDGKNWYIGQEELNAGLPVAYVSLKDWSWRGLTKKAHTAEFNEMVKKAAKLQQKIDRKSGSKDD